MEPKAKRPCHSFVDLVDTMARRPALVLMLTLAVRPVLGDGLDEFYETKGEDALRTLCENLGMDVDAVAPEELVPALRAHPQALELVAQVS